MKVAETKYAPSGDLRLAYQEFGEGPPLLIVPGLVSNMDVQWEHETVARIFDLLGRHLNVVTFDKRGIGLSDRPDVAPTLEERIGDIIAVMDAVGWEKTSLFGISEGGIMSQLFAAQYPERVDKLVLHNTVAPRRYFGRLRQFIEPGDAPILSAEESLRRFTNICDGWPDNTQEFVEWFMPSQANNEAFVRWCGRYQRLAASPRDARRQVESVFGLDAGDAPERITSPTMVIHVKGDRVLNVAMGRILAEVIPNATYLEVNGDDHFSWVLPN